MKQAIESLYQTFSHYRFTDMFGDPAFPGLCDPKPLLAAPLRELPSGAFKVFGWKAVTTWGNKDDLRFFLPRMLELSVTGEHHLVHLDLESIFQKINYAKWRTWPTAEQGAISRLVWALWDQQLNSHAVDPDKFVSNTRKPWLEFTFIDHTTEFLMSILRLESDFVVSLLHDWDLKINEQSRLEPISNLAAIFLDGVNSNEWSLVYGDWLTARERIESLEHAWERNQHSKFWSMYFSKAHEAAVNHLAAKRSSAEMK